MNTWFNFQNWRGTFAWGLIICYFTMPAAFFFGNVCGQQGWIKWDPGRFPNVHEFFQTVTWLIIGLAGLRSVDRYVDIAHGPTGKEASPDVTTILEPKPKEINESAPNRFSPATRT